MSVEPETTTAPEHPAESAEPLAQQQVKKNSVWEIPVSRPVKVESQEQLEEVLLAHERWISTVLNPRAELAEGRANVEGSDLSGLDLRGRDLRGANLSRVTLRGVDLSRTNLNGANLANADLTGATLRWTTLRRARLDHADLSETTIEGWDVEGASMLAVKGLKSAEARNAEVEEQSSNLNLEESIGQVVSDCDTASSVDQQP